MYIFYDQIEHASHEHQLCFIQKKSTHQLLKSLLTIKEEEEEEEDD